MAEDKPSEENTADPQAAESPGVDDSPHDVLETPPPEEPVVEPEPLEDEAAAAQIGELKDQVLRAVAEMENIKRRAARDVEHAHKFAVEKLLADLFPVVDSLEKAVETANATEGAAAIAEGVQLSLKLFVDTLNKSGVEQIDPLGEPFDPQVHEAMTMVPNPDAEPNSVMDVMQKGYVLNGRLVRAAKVIVVKGNGD